MNTLQTTLTALQSQLESQKQAAQYYTENVFNKEVESLQSKISDFLEKFFGERYDVTYDGSQLTIWTSDEKHWSSDAIRIDRYAYHGEKATARLSWYSSSCTVEDTKHRSYLKVLGLVATVLNQIDAEMPKWSEEYQQYSEKLYVTFLQPVSNTEFAIRKIEAQILEEGLESYKKPGFALTISPRTNCERHWEIPTDEIGAYSLESQPQYFELQTGRGRYDYVRVFAFEVVGPVKHGKVQMNIYTSSDPSYNASPIVVTKNRFDDFIATVYNWENFDKPVYNAKQTDKFNQHAKKVVENAAKKQLETI
jgi:hypothetical protein